MTSYLNVVDRPNSALDIVAKQRAKGDSCLIIYASDFKSSYGLLQHLLNSPVDRILFSWRGGLRESYLDIKNKAIYNRLVAVKTIHFLIPDLLCTENATQHLDQILISITHGYWVTSEELFEIYSRLFPKIKPLGILHDLPDITAISQQKNKSVKRSGLIWVGNSHWGSNYGFLDHKGFKAIVDPLTRLDLWCMPFRIIDSAKSRLNNLAVLENVAKSEILIQCSAHEGTGLPLLEAMGLGTVPITTKVGIAGEILTGPLRHLIIDRELQSFSEKIVFLEGSINEISRECVIAYEKYLERVLIERISWKRRDFEIFENRDQPRPSLKSKLIWFWRFLNARGRR